MRSSFRDWCAGYNTACNSVVESRRALACDERLLCPIRRSLAELPLLGSVLCYKMVNKLVDFGSYKGREWLCQK